MGEGVEAERSDAEGDLAVREARWRGGRDEKMVPELVRLLQREN